MHEKHSHVTSPETRSFLCQNKGEIGESKPPSISLLGFFKFVIFRHWEFGPPLDSPNSPEILA